MRASQSKAQIRCSSCVRDGSIYAPWLRARDHTTPKSLELMTFASARSSNCGAQGAVGDRSAAIRRANSRGVRYPKLLCGRSSLYSSFHAPIFARASNKLPNQLAFRHSSRNFPWKLSTYAFCTGRPGSMCTKSIFRSIPHARKCRDVNSGPLSHRIASGTPRSATIRSNSRVTRRLAKLVSTSSANHSRVYTSITLSTRNFLPLSAASCTKSSAHSWFAPVTAARTTPTRSNRFLLFRRIIRPASRYTRYTRLWFTCIPFASSFNCNLRYPQRGFSRAASTSRSCSALSFLRLTYRWLDSATPISPQMRRWLTKKCFHSQCTSSRCSTSSTRFFPSPPSACPCPGSDPQPASSTVRSHPRVAAIAAPLPRIDSVLAHAQFPPHFRRAPPRFHLLQRPNHLHFAILPLRHASPSPQNAIFIYTSARILGSRSDA